MTEYQSTKFSYKNNVYIVNTLRFLSLILKYYDKFKKFVCIVKNKKPSELIFITKTLFYTTRPHGTAADTQLLFILLAI